MSGKNVGKNGFFRADPARHASLIGVEPVIHAASPKQCNSGRDPGRGWKSGVKFWGALPGWDFPLKTRDLKVFFDE